MLDDPDKKLLRLLQQNNKLTTAQIGKAVNLSQSAVQRRLSRLRQEKIIEADISIISPSVGGYGNTCIIEVQLKDGGSKAVERFKTLMRDCMEVSQCYFVTGTYDLVAIVNTRDMQHFDVFSKKYLMDNPNVKHFHTQVVLDKVKLGYSVHI